MAAQTQNIWREYVVASIDMLGQKNELEKLEDFCIDEGPQGLLDEVASRTVAVIEELRSGFKEIIEAYTVKSESTAKVPEEHKAEYDAMRSSSPIEVQFYSDAIVAYVALRTTTYMTNDMVAILGMFGTIGGRFLINLATGSSFRASIDLGIGTKFDDKDLYGPVLVQVHRLESESAEYARIVVGNRLNSRLRTIADGHYRILGQSARDIDGSMRLADICLKLIERDQYDGQIILDYLGDEFRRRYNLDPSGKVYDIARQFIEEEYKKWNQSGEDKTVAKKYWKLRNYFNWKLPQSQ